MHFCSLNGCKWDSYKGRGRGGAAVNVNVNVDVSRHKLFCTLIASRLCPGLSPEARLQEGCLVTFPSSSSCLFQNFSFPATPTIVQNIISIIINIIRGYATRNSETLAHARGDLSLRIQSMYPILPSNTKKYIHHSLAYLQCSPILFCQ